VDEMGPLGVRTYPGVRWSPRHHRPKIDPDYGGHDTPVWVFGALEPATGVVVTQCARRRTRREFIGFLDTVVRRWPTGDIILILDNLSVHRTLDVRLWAIAHPRVRFLFQPTYSAWLNLIEPWWKTLRTLALKGRAFRLTDDLMQAISGGTQYWNDHRHPYVWRKTA
jgi:transposase